MEWWVWTPILMAVFALWGLFNFRAGENAADCGWNEQRKDYQHTLDLANEALRDVKLQMQRLEEELRWYRVLYEQDQRKNRLPAGTGEALRKLTEWKVPR